MPNESNRIMVFESARRCGKDYRAIEMIFGLYVKPKFVQLYYKKGMCHVYALALAFHTSLKDAMMIAEAVCKTPKDGATINEVDKCIRLAEAIYQRPTKIFWRGTLFNFCKEYQRGLFIINCSGHIGIVFNGVIFDRSVKDYQVYNVWQLTVKEPNLILAGIHEASLRNIREVLHKQMNNSPVFSRAEIEYNRKFI